MPNAVLWQYPKDKTKSKTDSIYNVPNAKPNDGEKQ